MKEYGWPPFRKRVWQRDYYEHIVRHAADRVRIRAYIANKPARWHGKPRPPTGAR